MTVRCKMRTQAPLLLTFMSRFTVSQAQVMVAKTPLNEHNELWIEHLGQEKISFSITQVVLTLVMWELLRCLLSRLRSLRCNSRQATMRPERVYMTPKGEKVHARRDCFSLRRSGVIEGQAPCKMCFQV